MPVASNRENDYEVRSMGYVSPCWVWLKGLSSTGYGSLQVETRTWRAHRYYYERHHGPIPDGLHIDHLCCVKTCVNPDHMEPVTLAENSRRHTRKQTHCRNGHPYDEENTKPMPEKGWRRCRTCLREACQRYHAKQRRLARGEEASE